MNNWTPNCLRLTKGLLGSSRGLGLLSSSTICHTHSLFSRAGSTPRLLLFLVIISWHWRLQNVGIFCRNWAALSLIASPWLSSWCQVSTFLQAPFNPGASNGTLAVPYTVTSPGLSQGQVALHGPSMPSKPAPPWWCLLSSSASLRWNLGHL